MSESFELKVPETLDIPKESLIRVIAKTLSDTIHPDDPQNPIRKFDENELALAARSLFGKPVGLNHQGDIPEALVVNADWNAKDKVVEAILSLPKKFKDLVQNREITKVSVEYIWDNVVKEAGKSIFKGLKFLGLSLLQGMNPGDPNAKILFESQSGREVMELTPTKEILDQDPNTTDIVDTGGEPCSPALRACVDDLIAKGTPEDHAWPICKARLGETEAIKVILTESATPEKIEEVRKKLKEHAELTKRVTDLEGAVSTAVKVSNDLKTSHDKDVQTARDEVTKTVKKEIIKQLDEIIVPSHVEFRFKQVSAKLLNTDVKRLKRRLETDGTS